MLMDGLFQLLTIKFHIIATNATSDIVGGTNKSLCQDLGHDGEMEADHIRKTCLSTYITNRPVIMVSRSKQLNGAPTAGLGNENTALFVCYCTGGLCR